VEYFGSLKLGSRLLSNISFSAAKSHEQTIEYFASTIERTEKLRQKIEKIYFHRLNMVDHKFKEIQEGFQEFFNIKEEEYIENIKRKLMQNVTKSMEQVREESIQKLNLKIAK